MKPYYFALVSLICFLAAAYHVKAQVSPVYYPSNYVRVVQPEVDDSSDQAYNINDLVSYSNTKVRFDTLLNPFTGGLNNPTFFNIDFNGDGIQDLYVFDRELGENQFLLFQGLSTKSISYRYAPQYHYQFPQDIHNWVELADYNKDGLPDLFTATSIQGSYTNIKVYKNTSYADKSAGNYVNRFVKAADPLYYETDTGPRQLINISTATNPQILDVDHHGYLDILAFDESLNAPLFFRNQEKGLDSLSFWFTKACWGYFEEYTQHLYSPWTCEEKSNGQPSWTGTYDPDTAEYKIHSMAHYNNSMCAFDVDCDGDIDLLLGDGLNDSLAYLENGYYDRGDPKVKNGGYFFDTIINLVPKNNNKFPIGSPPVITSMPTASYLDINHDTLNDLIVAAGQPTGTYQDTNVVDRIHNVYYYENQGSKDSTGKPTSNIFELDTKDFLVNTMVDWGINSAPCFIDVDNDGRKDLIIAVKDGGAINGFSHLILYLNKPGKTPGSKPYLLYKTDDYLGFAELKTNIYWPVPAAYLNTKDGKTDLLVGNASGGVMYFKNEGSSGGNPANFHLSTGALQYISHSSGMLMPINVEGANSAPTAADINGDGKTDLIIGSEFGNISYYRCLGFLPGPDNVPYFELVTDTLGGLNTVSGFEYQTAPCVADMDKDGKLDMLMGDEVGNLWYFHDFDTINPLMKNNKILIWDNGANRVDSNKIISTYIIPAVAELDQDTFPDIMMGCRRGGLIFLGSANNGFENLRNTATIVGSASISKPVVSLFPNPAKDMVTLEYNNTAEEQNALLVVSDILGRQVLNHSFVLVNGKGDEPFSTKDFTNGIYIVVLCSEDQLIYSNKLIICR